LLTSRRRLGTWAARRPKLRSLPTIPVP